MNHTVDGRKCQLWMSQQPHEHTMNIEERNFCRNPDGKHAPWCFTTDSDTRWQYCDVPFCDEGNVYGKGLNDMNGIIGHADDNFNFLKGSLT